VVRPQYYGPAREIFHVCVLYRGRTTWPCCADILILEDLLRGVSCLLSLKDDDRLLLQFLEQRQVIEWSRLIERFPQPCLVALVAVAVRHRYDRLVDTTIWPLRLETMHESYDRAIELPVLP